MSFHTPVRGLLVLALVACGTPTPAPTEPVPSPDPAAEPAPAPAAAPQPAAGDPAESLCAAVITANDATAMYQVGKSLKTTDDCVFEDVGVELSVVTLAFEKGEDDTKITATLRPSVCAEGKPPEGAVLKDPWLLEIPAESKAACPDGFKKLTDAVVTGRFPPPTVAR